jgi:hypothetical protein
MPEGQEYWIVELSNPGTDEGFAGFAGVEPVYEDEGGELRRSGEVAIVVFTEENKAHQFAAKAAEHGMYDPAVPTVGPLNTDFFRLAPGAIEGLIALDPDEYPDIIPRHRYMTAREFTDQL